MIIFLGKGLIFWTGILTGLFFILSFLGCRCLNGNGSKINWKTRYHKGLMRATFIFFMIHAILAILASFGKYV